LRSGLAAEATLVCHPDSARGDVERVRLPPARAPRIAQGLWRYTCCEIFVARVGSPAYHEFNFAPSGEWAAYAFERYREGVLLRDDSLDPRIY